MRCVERLCSRLLSCPFIHHGMWSVQAILCIWRLLDQEWSWKAPVLLSLHILLQASFGISLAAEEVAVRVLRHIWADADAVDIVLAVKPLPLLWPYVAVGWGRCLMPRCLPNKAAHSLTGTHMPITSLLMQRCRCSMHDKSSLTLHCNG